MYGLLLRNYCHPIDVCSIESTNKNVGHVAYTFLIALTKGMQLRCEPSNKWLDES